MRLAPLAVSALLACSLAARVAPARAADADPEGVKKPDTTTGTLEVTPPPISLRRSPPKPDFAWTYPRFRTVEGIATIVFGLAVVGGAVIPPSKNPWITTSSFDESVRNTLRAPTVGERDAARDASDVLLAFNVANPLLVDSLAAAYWRHRSPDVAFQMAAIDVEAFALNGALSTMFSSLTTRQRPYGRLCPADLALQNRDCATDQRYKSFFSGHSSTSFTGAALVCSHHAHYALFGGGAPDVIACIAALVSAGSTAAFRVVADQHYITDVVTGSAVGTMSGLAVPWLLHYRSPIKLTQTTGAATWTFIPSPSGVSVVGVF